MVDDLLVIHLVGFKLVDSLGSLLKWGDALDLGVFTATMGLLGAGLLEE